MPSLPLPFVVSLLLILLLARLIGQREPSLRPAIVFVAACALLTMIVGLRWSFDVRGMRFIQPVVASSLPPIAWFCFSGLAGERRAGRLWIHAVPVGVMACLSATWPLWHPPIDLLLAAVFFGYGIALLRLGSSGPDGFVATRLSEAARTHRATLVAGLVLTGSGAVDVLIAGDFAVFQGAHAALIVGIANLVTLPLIAYAVAIVGQGASVSGASEPVPDRPTDEAAVSPRSLPPQLSAADDARIIDAIEQSMQQKQLFRDPDLTLSRLARRTGIPSRQISMAINRTFGRNVSQLVNGYRIDEARRLLVQSDLPITTIMFEVGFQTKSNFNREFLRITGMSPSDFRRSGAQPSRERGASAEELPSPEMP